MIFGYQKKRLENAKTLASRLSKARLPKNLKLSVEARQELLKEIERKKAVRGEDKRLLTVVTEDLEEVERLSKNPNLLKQWEGVSEVVIAKENLHDGMIVEKRFIGPGETTPTVQRGEPGNYAEGKMQGTTFLKADGSKILLLKPVVSQTNKSFSDVMSRAPKTARKFRKLKNKTPKTLEPTPYDFSKIPKTGVPLTMVSRQGAKIYLPESYRDLTQLKNPRVSPIPKMYEMRNVLEVNVRPLSASQIRTLERLPRVRKLKKVRQV